MNEDAQKQNDEISLIDLFAVLWRRRIMIIIITLVGVIGSVAFSVFSLLLPPEKSPLPNQYTPAALVLINDKSSSPSSSLSSMLNNSNMSGLASLAGINISGTQTLSELVLFLMTTNSLLDSVVDEFDLITRYKIEKYFRAQSRKELKKNLLAERDELSGVITISFTDIDPEFARNVVDFTVKFLENRFGELDLDKNKIERDNLETNIKNTFEEILRLEDESRKLGQSVAFGAAPGGFPAIATEMARLEMELEAKRQVYIQLMVQNELIRVSMASETPAFQVLEMAEIPDQKSGPSRGLICIIVTFAFGFLAVFLAFALNAIENIKNDPESMTKLRGKN